MLAEQLSDAISTARTMAMLDNAARLTWRGLAEGLIDEQAAEWLSTAMEARKLVLTGRRLPGRRSPPAGEMSDRTEGVAGRSLTESESVSLARQRPCRSPDRARSIGRRRRLAASGAVPGTIAAGFTTGELAVLTLIARECQRRGRCAWFMDRLAAVAGVCRTTARNALRQAQAVGLVTVQERRWRGWRSDSNVVRVVSPEWIAWLRLGGGGCKKPKSTNTDYSKIAQDNKDLFTFRSGHSVEEHLYPPHGNRHRRTYPPHHP